MSGIGLFLYWVFLLVMVLLVPGVMLFFGRELEKNPPEEINSGYGYRTTWSMKSKLTWDFAQVYSGKLWQKWGKILLPVSVAPMLFALVLGRGIEPVSYVSLVICGVDLVVMLGTMIPVEKALKRNFDQYGIPYSE